MSTIKPSPLDVDALLAFHRATFGDARMEADDPDGGHDAPETDNERPTPADLGDPGKKALAAERAAKREAEKKANEAAARAAELEAKIAEFERSKMDAQDRLAAERDDWRKKYEEQAAVAAARELELLRRDVAHDKGLPPGLARRLQGNSREELEALLTRSLAAGAIGAVVLIGVVALTPVGDRVSSAFDADAPGEAARRPAP